MNALLFKKIRENSERQSYQKNTTVKQNQKAVDMVEISAGKEKYKLFKKRYFLTVGPVTTYYYSEYDFWLAFFKACEDHDASFLDKIKLGYAIK